MTDKKAIHQLLHTLSYGDAISAEVLTLQRVFRNSGYESEIYSINTHPKFKDQARSFEELSEDFDGQIVFHYSLGSPLNELYRKLSSAKRSLIFHNLTPPDWFRGVNPRIVRDIEAGEQELPELCGITDLLIADSSFNAGELKKLGFEARVLELPVDHVKWGIETNPGIASLVQSEGGIQLLHVGRLAPNKCIEDVIKVFYFIHHKINRNSRLWLPGIDIDTELYSFSLRRMAEEFDLTDAVNFAGCMADSEVKALYQNCTAYLCMSEHEGFCLPLIEAMYFGLPVVAFSSSAVPDTVGTGGIVVKEKKHPEIAELINRIHEDQSFRKELQTAGHKRVEELSTDIFEKNAVKVFGLQV